MTDYNTIQLNKSLSDSRLYQIIFIRLQAKRKSPSIQKLIGEYTKAQVELIPSVQTKLISYRTSHPCRTSFYLPISTITTISLRRAIGVIVMLSRYAVVVVDIVVVQTASWVLSTALFHGFSTFDMPVWLLFLSIRSSQHSPPWRCCQAIAGHEHHNQKECHHLHFKTWYYWSKWF